MKPPLPPTRASFPLSQPSPHPLGALTVRIPTPPARPRPGAALALLWLLVRAAAPPAVCAPGDSGCLRLSVADLFDRVIRHSGRIHSLSTALCAELVGAGTAFGRVGRKGRGLSSGFSPPPQENRFPARDNELGKPARRCPTAGMLTPNGKEYAQKIPREELTYVILKLLHAWKEPLSHFNQHMEHHQELPDDSLSKAKQISKMVHELETGIEKVTEKMQSMGIIGNSLHGMASSEAAGFSSTNEANMMSDSDFIHCFKRDSNKVQCYLKILKYVQIVL
ncbi:Prolactin-like protein [Aix galericulata]|nr:Prolactin-like protein [Aix galericulata]